MLSPAKRKEIYLSIVANARYVSVGWSTVQEIDSFNIRSATLLAMRRALEEVLELGMLSGTILVAIDGLDAIPDLPLPQKTVIGGDQRILSIAAASIVAKFSRDRFMEKVDMELPDYRFREHKGYGTAIHRELIRKFGLSPVHRPLFCRKFNP
jgi:ribonuclease HII